MAALFRLQRMMMAMLMLASFLAGSGLSFLPPDTQTANQEETSEACPPCEIFFRKLEKNERNGKLSQVVRVQERGEPKSGTGFMFDWATGALMRTCNYLQRLYGEATYTCVCLGRNGLHNSSTRGQAGTRFRTES